MRSVQPCPDCHGTGKIVKEKCPDCYGTGYISSKKTIEVNIPAGIDNGQCVRIQGKGEPGTNGGPRGDLLVAVMISADPAFERDGYNIFSDVVISYPTAVLGGEVKVKTVDGEVIVDIPTKLNNEQKEALMEYDKTLTGEEHKHPKKKGFFK